MEIPVPAVLRRRSATSERVDVVERGVSLRAVALGAGLIIPNCFWIMKVEGIWHTNHATAMSLFWNSIFCLLVLVGVNLLLKKRAPRLAFSQAELITVYVMLNIGSALAGHDSLQLGIPQLTMPFWYANGPRENWKDLILPHYPQYPYTLQDTDFLRAYYIGDSSFYRWEVIRVWLLPVLWWCAFIMALGAVMICWNVILRKQWMENEKLSYPVVQLPMAMTAEGGSKAFFTQRLLWVGIAIGASIDILNGLNVLFPSVPGITVRHDAPGRDLAGYMTSSPWNSVGWFPLPLYPFLIAMGYFLPLDLGFSIWFFFLFKKALLIYGGAMGFNASGTSQYPYHLQQSYGAWGVIIFLALWAGRRHFSQVFQTAFTRHRPLDDSREPLGYRTAILGIVLGSAFITWFCLMAGMKLWVVLCFFTIFYLISIGITRIRAELGPPAHEILGMNAGTLMIMGFGTQAIGGPGLAMFTMFWWFSGRGYRTHTMPCQLEAFKMAHEGKANAKGMGWAMILAMAIGGIASFWAALAQQYQFGSTGNYLMAHNWGQPYQLQDWIANPKPTDWNSMFFVGVGGVAAFGMQLLRTRFTWWPFHPAGYALSLNYGTEYFWSCLMVASLIKWAVLRYGGYKLSRQIVPLMFGVILGEFMVGAFWSAMSVALSVNGVPFRTYDFSPG